MITYLYWITVFALIIALLVFIGHKIEQWKYAFIAAGIVFIIGWSAYYFHFQQIFVKKYGDILFKDKLCIVYQGDIITTMSRISGDNMFSMIHVTVSKDTLKACQNMSIATL